MMASKYSAMFSNSRASRVRPSSKTLFLFLPFSDRDVCGGHSNGGVTQVVMIGMTK